MPSYSHSKLSTFNQCKYKYKLRYIDKIRIDLPESIELFLGKRVHEALEKIYKDIQTLSTPPSKAEIINFFNHEWKKHWKNNITIVKDITADEYKKQAIQFIENYYDTYHPFDQEETIAIETTKFLPLKNNNSYHIRIDRLAKDQNNNYYIIDYKTNNRLKTQEELDSDTQLAMYSLWVKSNYVNCNEVKLVWHFLAHNKRLQSKRDDNQLLKLKEQTEQQISIIESCTQFPTHKTKLCDWCEFKTICPEFKTEPNYKGQQDKQSSLFDHF